MSRQPLGGGDARLRAQVRGGSGGARRLARVGRAGVRADRRLLGLRLPQGPLGGVRAARLPVHLAARALRAGVPLRPAQRAADGLLPARRAGARGAAARASRCCHPTCCASGVAVRGGAPRGRPCGSHGPRLCARRARGGRARDRGGARAGRPVRVARRTSRRAARAQGDALEQLAWAGACDSLCSGRREALWLLGVVGAGRAGARRHPAGAAARDRRRARAAPSSRRGSGCWPTTAPRT